MQGILSPSGTAALLSSSATFSDALCPPRLCRCPRRCGLLVVPFWVLVRDLSARRVLAKRSSLRAAERAHWPR